MTTHETIHWDALEALIRRDPTARGVASFQDDDGPLCAGQLAMAARQLAHHATCVAIVTGFCVVDAHPPAAETDGPPGALVLARALRELGIDVALVTDHFGAPLLQAGCDLIELSRDVIVEAPLNDDTWFERFWRGALGRRISHLVAIERVGPIHTVESLLAQPRAGAAPLAEFEREVPEASRDVCHNMRGMPVDAVTAPLHRLFEMAASRIVTIGICDGGNEIGMGRIPWETLRRAIAQGHAARVACRVATDYTLVAGVSNWAGYALALAVCALRGRRDLVEASDSRQIGQLVECLVRAGAVDGVTRRREATVDGLPLTAEMRVFTEIRDVCRAAAP